MPVEEIEAKNFFSFMYFHSPSAAQPHGWPVLMKNGKVRKLRLVDGHALSKWVLREVEGSLADTPGKLPNQALHRTLDSANELVR